MKGLYERDLFTLIKCSVILCLYLIALAVAVANTNYQNKLLLAKMGSVMSVNIMNKVLSYAIIRNTFYKIGDILNLV